MNHSLSSLVVLLRSSLSMLVARGFSSQRHSLGSDLASISLPESGSFCDGFSTASGSLGRGGSLWSSFLSPWTDAFQQSTFLSFLLYQYILLLNEGWTRRWCCGESMVVPAVSCRTCLHQLHKMSPLTLGLWSSIWAWSYLLDVYHYCWSHR